MPRDTIISVINLRKCLGYEDADSKDGLLFITNFNNLNTGFHVDTVLGIHRVSWKDINEPDSTISSDAGGTATGVLKWEDRLIVIIDFEKIVAGINTETSLKVSDLDNYETKDRSASPLLIAEDSKMLMKMIQESLTKAGYTNITPCYNGKEAWDRLRELREKGTALNDVHLIITDIEMPQMDGHRLCKLIKEDDTLKKIPVVIFSSLINDDIRRKGEAVGADEQLTKPEIGKLVGAVDRLVAQYEQYRSEDK
jgi:two-component system chemotaxis response regulator CheV